MIRWLAALALAALAGVFVYLAGGSGEGKKPESPTASMIIGGILVLLALALVAS